MEISELDHIIRTSFNIEEDVDIIGFEDERQRIIPLSYLLLNVGFPPLTPSRAISRQFVK